MYRSSLLAVLLCFLVALPAVAQERERGMDYRQLRSWIGRQASKPYVAAASNCGPDVTRRRDAILNGNRVTTQILNFGSISAPGNTITDIVWNGLGYGYEFGPFVAAEIIDEGHKDPQSVPKRDNLGNLVKDAAGDTVWVMHIVSDGLVSNGGEISPDGKTNWGWEPIPCAQPVGNFGGIDVVSPQSDQIPTSDARDTNLDGKPDSWPDSWFNANLGEYVWPGALQQGASNADKEALYFMNDYNNCEFAYDPFPSNPNLNCGLGLEVEVRIYQWANPLAEDAIFLIYKITNKSERDLDNVRFGMWGDPHIGGPRDWPDDWALFDSTRNMVFAWDADGRSDVPGRPPGYLGYKFLESPGIGNECLGARGADAATCAAAGGRFVPGDGKDNDKDGMTDESWTDGIDNDGDWDPEFDDVGIDGIPGTGDEGEGDGRPTGGDQFDITKPGEPNFEFTDIDESDMIGLTSFASPAFSGNRISNDDRVWNQITPGSFEDVPGEPGDYVFLYGAGTFALRAGDTKRFSIALVLGENRNDLELNAETVQTVFNAGYRFAKPPLKPIVTAVPGDQKVTLYWDKRAETSVDPLTREQDFEGYVIYRSTDASFSDVQTITDINGSKFLFRPLESERGVEAKFDLNNGVRGPAPVPFPRRGVAYDLGEDTGLYHTYVDSNNVVNGQTYYYAVVAYDRGLIDDGAGAGGIPPSETAKTVTYNPVDDSYIFDVNTVSVIPRPRAAGYVPPSIEAAGGLVHAGGTATGDIVIDIVDELAVRADRPYEVDFEVIEGKTVYSVIDRGQTSVELKAKVGKTHTLFVTNVLPETFVLKKAGGATLTAGTDYELLSETGTIRILAGGAVQEGDALVATFSYAPVYRSSLTKLEEGNLVFDGLHVSVKDEPLALNLKDSGFVQGGDGLAGVPAVASAGPRRLAQPFDYEIRFADGPVSTSLSTNLPLPFEVFNLTRANQKLTVFVPDVVRNGEWDLSEPIIFVEDIDGRQTATWQVTVVDVDSTGAFPGGGDVYYLRTDKSFTDADRYTFQTSAATTEAALVKQELRDIYVVPNPYVATNVLEPRNPISNSERGDRRLYFANVPAKCTIRIYSLAGELVDTIEHDSTIDDGKAFWDLRTKDNMNIAYGLYLFHVDSDEGSYTGKFAVIK